MHRVHDCLAVRCPNFGVDAEPETIVERDIARVRRNQTTGQGLLVADCQDWRRSSGTQPGSLPAGSYADVLQRPVSLLEGMATRRHDRREGIVSPNVASVLGDDRPPALDVVGTDKGDVGWDPRDGHVGRIGYIGVSAFEDEIGNESHPGAAESRPALIVGLDPPQVGIVGERVDPQVNDRPKISSERMPKPNSHAVHSVATGTVSKESAAPIDGSGCASATTNVPRHARRAAPHRVALKLLALGSSWSFRQERST